MRPFFKAYLQALFFTTIAIGAALLLVFGLINSVWSLFRVGVVLASLCVLSCPLICVLVGRKNISNPYQWILLFILIPANYICAVLLYTLFRMWTDGFRIDLNQMR